MNTFVSRWSSYFPDRWPLSYLNLTKDMKAYIRRQQQNNLNTKTQNKKNHHILSPWNDQQYKITGGLKSVLHGHNLTHSFYSGSQHLVSSSVLVVKLLRYDDRVYQMSVTIDKIVN